MSLKIFNEVGKHVPGDCSLREQQDRCPDRNALFNESHDSLLISSRPIIII